MKLGIYQGPTIGHDEAAAFALIRQTLASAKLSGADLLVFPELFIPGYNRPDLHHELAQPRGGAWEQTFADMAREAGCAMVMGWPERDGDTIYNAATFYGRDGAVLGHYRKIQLFGRMEKSVFDYGNSYCVFDFEGAKIGLLICYDIEFAQHAWALRELGAEVLLIPTANPIAFDNVPDLLVPARAAENGMVVAYANYCGTQGDVTFGGKSMVIDRNGTPLATAGRGPALLIVDTDCPDTLSRQHRDYRPIA